MGATQDVCFIRLATNRFASRFLTHLSRPAAHQCRQSKTTRDEAKEQDETTQQKRISQVMKSSAVVASFTRRVASRLAAPQLMRAGASRLAPSLSSMHSAGRPAVAFFSSDSSHDDFAPKRKTVDDVDEAIEMIKDHVQANHIMLYMKGNPSMPMCGFSARVVQVLQAEGVDFSSVNVLDYPSIREGVKKFS